MAKTINIGTLISGGGTNLQAIIDACASNQIDAKILFTGSDTPGVKGLERKKKAGIDTFVVDYASKWLLINVVEMPVRQFMEITPFFNLRMVWNKGFRALSAVTVPPDAGSGASDSTFCAGVSRVAVAAAPSTAPRSCLPSIHIRRAYFDRTKHPRR